MAYDEDTLDPCHDLTLIGRLNYEEMLETYYDEGLYPYEHPIKFLLEKIQ